MRILTAQLEETLLLLMVPETMSLKDTMAASVTFMLLPTVKRVREAAHASAVAGPARVMLGGESTTSHPFADPSRPLPRAVITLDGEEAHLSAIFTHLVDTGVAKESGIECMKFAASCSKVQQPCDVAPSYRTFKQDLKLDPKSEPAPFADHLDKILRHIKAGSRHTFREFLSHLPERLSKAFTIGAVGRGWQVSGLWPYDPIQILAQNPAWTSLPNHVALSAKRSLIELIAYAMEHGEVHEAQLDEALGGVAPPDVISEGESDDEEDKGAHVPRKRARKPLGEHALNRRRTVWLTHPLVLEEREARQAAKMAAAAAREAARAGKAAKKSQPSQKKKSPPKRKLDAAKAASSPLQSKRCGNLVCCKPIEEGDDFDECSTCGVNFCVQEECVYALQCHELVC
jgi:hypothetical protein